MKKLLNSILLHLGYELRRVKMPGSMSAAERTLKELRFQGEDDFRIEFSHVTLDGNHYFAPRYALHRPAVAMLLRGRFYEPDTHQFVKFFFQQHSGSMIHAGTFYGDMIPTFAKAVSGRLYAFEPVLENYVLAKLCVDSNDLSNVILVNSALSDSLCNLFVDTGFGEGKHAGGGSKVSENGKICSAMTIDGLELKDLALLQLDVEGHELNALKGARKTISKSRPVIAIEDLNNDCSNFLLDLCYEAAGQIPGLKIWLPSETNQYKKTISDFLDQNKL